MKATNEQQTGAKTIKGVKFSGNGETVRVRIARGWLEGRLFFVKPLTWDLLTTGGESKRVITSEIIDIS